MVEKKFLGPFQDMWLEWISWQFIGGMGVKITIEIGIALCRIPHNSEHWPKNIPSINIKKVPLEILPGMQSNLKFNPRIVIECKTSAADPTIKDLWHLKISMEDEMSIPQILPRIKLEFKIISVPHSIQYHWIPKTLKVDKKLILELKVPDRTKMLIEIIKEATKIKPTNSIDSEYERISSVELKGAQSANITGRIIPSTQTFKNSNSII